MPRIILVGGKSLRGSAAQTLGIGYQFTGIISTD